MNAAQLFEQHHAALFRYLVRLTGDADHAHDVVQETFTRLVARPPRNENPRAWLFTVATNIVRASANRTARHRLILAGSAAHVPVPAAPAQPDAVAEERDEAARVRAALDTLSERDRTILLMREEGFTHREIADAVGTTTGSVGTMIARALERLARLLPLDGLEETA